MKATTKNILRVMHIVSWIIFIGMCIQTGAIAYSFIVSLINTAGARNLYEGLDLSGLYSYNLRHYGVMVSFLILLSGLKAYMFYFIIKIFFKINFVHPFSTEVAALIRKISYVALGIGVLGIIANLYSEWLIKRGVELPNLQRHLGGAGEYLFLAATIFVIAQVFKRGIEIQSENELTV